MSTDSDGRPMDEDAEGQGADLGVGENTTFEPEEDPDAVDEPRER
jgi:hypothetical protein